MSFGICDIITCEVIKDGLLHLSRNPKHIEHILGVFSCNDLVLKNVGREYLAQCIQYIMDNRVEVAPYYAIDVKRRPSISVISSGSEDTQFLGDYGFEQNMNMNMPAVVYAQWDATAISKDEMTVTADYKLDTKLWIGMFISNGQHTVRLTGILKKSGEPTTLFLDQELPDNTRLTAWTAKSSEKGRGATVSASMDAVTVQCKLTTNGDFSIHRLMSIVTRYCLKRGRLLFDQYGMQVASFSYTPPMLTEQDEHEFESVYTINAKFTDTWIEKEYDLADSAANVVVSLIVHSEKPSNEDVPLPVDLILDS